MIARTLTPALEDINLKNNLATAKLVWQPRGYDPHLHKWLHRIDVPTLLLWGDTDRLYPKEYAEAFHKLIPGFARGRVLRVRPHPQCRESGRFRGRGRALCQRGEGRRMKIFNFHLMPYGPADLDAIQKNGSAWVTFSNKHYDPGEGRRALSPLSRRDSSSPTSSASTASASTSITRPPTA